MLKTVTINIDRVKQSDRLEPDFWVIGKFIDEVLQHYKHKKISEYSKFIKKGIFDLKAERYQTKGVPFLRISNLKYFELGTEDLGRSGTLLTIYTNSNNEEEERMI